MKIVSLADLHGDLDIEIPQCDTLCICGDIIPLEIQGRVLDSLYWWTHNFVDWCKGLIDSGNAKNIVLTAGNHDFACEVNGFEKMLNEALQRKKILNCVYYLNRSSVIIDGIKFYGTPYSDIRGWAFYTNEDYTFYIPEPNTDVLLVHQAPNLGGLGTTLLDGKEHNFGSDLLIKAIQEVTPSYLFCGHIHGGVHIPVTRTFENGETCTCVNTSIKDEQYRSTYKPFLITI